MKKTKALLFTISGCIVVTLLTSCNLPMGRLRNQAVKSSSTESKTPGQPSANQVQAKTRSHRKERDAYRQLALSHDYKDRIASAKRHRLSNRPPLFGIGGDQLFVRTTAYSHNEKDHLVYKRKTAAGTTLQYGSQIRSAAADWSKFPVGTQFQIASEPGVTYVIDDYGSALVGTETIDIYKPSIKSMNRWGVRHVSIEILKWGSFQESLRIMFPRSKFQHVRRMLDGIMEKNAA